MKYLFVTFSFLFICSQNLYASTGLTTNIVFREFKITTLPIKRRNFKSSRAIQIYKEKNNEKIRNILTPHIDPFKKVVIKYQSMGLKIIDFDPLYETLFIRPESKGAHYSETPKSYKIDISNDERKDFYYLTVSLSSFDNIDLLLTFSSEIKSLIHSEQDVALKKMEKFSSKEVRELKEKIKFKEYHFFKFQKYFALYVGTETLIESSFVKDFHSSMNRVFINFFDSFKLRFMTSSSIKNYVNKNVIQDIQSNIEKENYKNLESPFTASLNVLPKGTLRKMFIQNDIHFIYLIKVDKHANTNLQTDIMKIAQDSMK